MSQNNFSFDQFRTFISDNFTLIVIALILYGFGFLSGSLYTENAILKQGNNPSGTTTTTTTTPTETAGGGNEGPTQEQLAAMPELTEADHVRGSLDAPVVLVEYSDYECPFCGRFHPTMTQLREEFGDDIAWVYRHFPLSFHPNAQKAAEASECIAQQAGEDAFWTYTDAIFVENQAEGKLSPEIIQSSAEAAGVDMTSFNNCLDSGEMADLVKDQMDAGAQAGVNATPGTILVTEDGPQELISGAQPIEQVRSIIESYL